MVQFFLGLSFRERLAADPTSKSLEWRFEMKRSIRQGFILTGILFLLFLMFTAAVRTVDVQPVGPRQSSVGFASLNTFIAGRLGENLLWYHITEWLGAAAILTAAGFGCLGLVQLVKRKSLLRVDRDLLVLGAFYLAVIAFYALFEVVVVNYRPVILEKGLEASYPSSHTMAVLCIMAAAAMQFRHRMKNKALRVTAEAACVLMIVVTVAGRLLSGVHWFTDIAGGVLLGAALVMLYGSAVRYVEDRNQ